jgi:hypothetical protein
MSSGPCPPCMYKNFLDPPIRNKETTNKMNKFTKSDSYVLASSEQRAAFSRSTVEALFVAQFSRLTVARRVNPADEHVWACRTFLVLMMFTRQAICNISQAQSPHRPDRPKGLILMRSKVASSWHWHLLLACLPAGVLFWLLFG